MRILLLFLLAVCANAQVTITVNSSNAISGRAARVNATLSAGARVYAQFGSTTSYGQRSASVPGTTSAVIVMHGLPPSTLVHYRICQTAFTPPTGCSTDQTLTTTADTSPTPALPDPVDTTYPASFTTTYSVSSDCSNLQSQINTAAAQNGNNNYLISIPAGSTCAGKITNPVKTGANPNGTGTIVVASDGVLPPPGTRITPDWQSQMVTMLQTTVDDGFPSWNGPNPATCTPLQYQWRADQGFWYVCLTTNTWTAISATTGYTSGSTVPPSTTCDDPSEAGRYYERSGVGNNGLYYCYEGLRWILVTRSTSGSSPAPGGAAVAFPDVGSSATVTGYRYVGINFRPMLTNYSRNNESVSFSSGASRILLDRCRFWNPRTGAGGGIGLNGANVGVIDSYIDLVPWGNNASPAINVTAGTGPFAIQNNNIGGCFIPFFVNDNNGTLPRDSFDIRRNEIYMQSECNPRSPSYDGRGDRDARAAIEMKRGVKVLIEGNVFHNWSPAGAPINGAALLLTPRASPSTGNDDNATGMSDITIRSNTFRTGTGGIEIWGNDDQGYRGTRPTARMLVENNLGYGIDGKTNYFVTATRAPFLYIQDGIDWLTVRNNTWIDAKGTSPAIMSFNSPMGALVFRNNLLWLNPGDGVAGGDAGGGGIRWVDGTFTTLCDGTTTANTATAKTKLDKCGIAGAVTDYTMTNSVIIGGSAGFTSTYQPAYPTGNLWPGDTTSGITAVGFRDYASQNYALKVSSTYAPNGVGADLDTLRVAQGETYNLRTLDVSGSAATIYWTAPDTTTACTVEYGTSATVGTGTRVTDTPTGFFRSRAISGLSPNTLYYYRVYCKQMQSSSFRTK